MANAPKVRVAVLGNRFAAQAHLPALRWAGGAEVVGLAGHDAGRLEVTRETWGLPLVTTHWEELLELRPDLAIVCTPVDLHAPMARAFLESGAAVLCEKPFALDAAEAQELVAAANGRPAWVNHQLRFNPVRRHMRELVRSGAVGEPELAEVRTYAGHDAFRARPWSWWFDARRGGGILGALGSHMVDGVRWMLGEIDAVQGLLATLTDERPDPDGELRPVTADDHAHFSCRTAGGTWAHLQTSVARRAPHSSWFEVSGPEGALRLIDESELWRAGASGPFERVALPVDLPSNTELAMPEGGGFTRSLPLFLRELVGAVREKRSLSHAATFHDGLAVQRVLDAVRASSVAGGAEQSARSA